MILTANIENSKIFIGCADENTGRILFDESVSTDLNKTGAEYSILIRELLALYNIDAASIEGGIISSCVPPLTDVIKTSMQKLLHKNILEVGPGIRTGVDIRIDDPSELGADLLSAAAAGIKEYGAPLVIINLCTVSTVSIIDKDRRFIGNIFTAGIDLSAESLKAKTAVLPNVSVKRPAKLIGTTTRESVQSGVIYGTAAMLDGLIERISEELDCKEEGLTAVITGEYADTVAQCCKKHLWVDEHLLMKGLVSIYMRNRRSQKV